MCSVSSCELLHLGQRQDGSWLGEGEAWVWGGPQGHSRDQAPRSPPLPARAAWRLGGAARQALVQ